MLAISEAKYLSDFKILLTFNNNKQGVLNFQPIIAQDNREIFRDLENLSYFQDFKLRSGTLCWANELEFAPEFLFFQLFKEHPNYRNLFAEWGYLTAS